MKDQEMKTEIKMKRDHQEAKKEKKNITAGLEEERKDLKGRKERITSNLKLFYSNSLRPNFSQNKIRFGNKSIDESYDEMRRKQRQLEYYIDEFNLDERQSVSRPSWRTMREIPKFENNRSGRVIFFLINKNYFNSWEFSQKYLRCLDVLIEMIEGQLKQEKENLHI